MAEPLGIAGSGAIACGLAGSRGHGATLWARSDESAERARAKLPDEGAQVTTDLERPRRMRHRGRDGGRGARGQAPSCWSICTACWAPDALLATTTSSLTSQALAEPAGRPDRFAAFHVFNPVQRMELVELAFPDRR